MTTAATKTNKSDPPVADSTGASPVASEGDAETITRTVGETAPVAKAGILTKDVAEALADPMYAGRSPADAVDESSAARPEENGW